MQTTTPFFLASLICLSGLSEFLLAQDIGDGDRAASSALLGEVGAYVDVRLKEFAEIPDQRKNELQTLANYIRDGNSKGLPIKLTFICTHNSRRSHLSQIWAAVAAAHFEIANVETYSGGTESTAFNPRAVAALERAGMKIATDGQAENPRYKVQFSKSQPPLICFSKVFSDQPNPQTGFCAVMTCSSADRHCPSVPGAAKRLAIPYLDPKISDGTDQEAATYDERCAQICREMLYAFSQVL